jgi:tetraacyldisaccharide 4'-kinase
LRFLWRTDEPLWLKTALLPLTAASWAYAAAAAVRRPAVFRAPVPAISVGNVVAGGAGKTPVAMEIVRRLLRRGRKAAILSRGYGRRGGKDLEVAAGTPWDEAGDEPALLKQRFPEALVLVGARRASLAARAASQGAEVLVLDDGLQHLSLARDLDVVVMDASNPLGNGRRLPRGPLRERPASAFRRVGTRGLLWLTRCDLPRDRRTNALVAAAREAGLRGPVESAYATAAPIGKEAAFLFAGIARPASFEALVRSAGAGVVGSRWFPDHHRYSSGDLQNLRRTAAAHGATRLLTTEKDLVRIPASDRVAQPLIEAVPVDLRILSGEDALLSALDLALGVRA